MNLNWWVIRVIISNEKVSKGYRGFLIQYTVDLQVVLLKSSGMSVTSVSGVGFLEPSFIHSSPCLASGGS